ncbi:MAG: hypothetical protein ACD_33C00046G0009 [uncultured bacterium]|nr:MAG: hypothetical protein ACD_33C00046G0009 [uncultured bacterium]
MEDITTGFTLVDIVNNLSNKVGIYLIKCNDKFYIGSCSDLKYRFSIHEFKLRTHDITNKYRPNKNLLKEYKINPELFFYYKLIENREDAYDEEQRLLDLHIGKEYCCNDAPDARSNKGVKHIDTERFRRNGLKYYEEHPEACVKASNDRLELLKNKPDELARVIAMCVARANAVSINSIQYDNQFVASETLGIPTTTLRRYLDSPRHPTHYRIKDMFERPCNIKGSEYESVDKYSIETNLSAEIALSRIQSSDEWNSSYKWID